MYLCILSPWSRVLEKLTGSQLVKKFPALYGTRRFITDLQVPATIPYPESDQASPCPSIPFPEDPSQYYPSVYAWFFQVASFPWFSHQNPVYTLLSPIHATRLAHCILLDLITRIIFGE